MLARVANNLFWMGRYIERSEHVARYLNVNYFSSLDAPSIKSQSRQLVLRSMMYMADTKEIDPSVVLDEQQVLYDIALNPDKQYSIFNTVKNARENANSARDVISTELYEALNKFYHTVLNYNAEHFKTKGLFDFTTQVMEACAILRAKIRGTLFHDEIYAIIMCGLHIERGIQVCRIVHSKYRDALNSKIQDSEVMGDSYEWITLLKCVESHDMMRRHYRRIPNSLSVIEFLILHPNCPRSVMNCMNQVDRRIKVLSMEKLPSKESAAYLIGKTRAYLQYLQAFEIEENIEGQLFSIQENLNAIANKIEAEYFNY